MMRKSKFRSALSLLLALIMMAGLWVPAWATDEEMIEQPVSVTATGGDISAAVGNQPAAPEQVEVDAGVIGGRGLPGERDRDDAAGRRIGGQLPVQDIIGGPCHGHVGGFCLCGLQGHRFQS